MNNVLAWESVSWRSGEDQYRFAIERGGLFATLLAPGDRALTLPMVVWEGLFDALNANRTTRKRAERQFPVRSRARWYDGEAAELVEQFKAGRSIAALAKVHNRSEYAIEHQLDKLGLISTADRYGPAASGERLESAPRSFMGSLQSNEAESAGPDRPGD